MQILQRVIFFVILVNLSFIYIIPAHGQNFEGEIIFIKQDNLDTSYISYQIKGNKVRFEELNNRKQVDNYIIADLNKKNILAINPKRKLYVSLPVYQWNNVPDTINYQTTKTGNHKTIKGFNCFQWRIINKQEDTEVQFWAPENHFDFYLNFLQIINQPVKTSIYYLNSPGIYSKLPFEYNERSLLRELRMHMEVLSIEKKSLQDALFEIPQGFRLFEKN